MTSTVELDPSSARARVVSAPASHNLTKGIRWLAIRRFLLSGLVFGVGLGAAWYGTNGGPSGGLSKALTMPM